MLKNYLLDQADRTLQSYAHQAEGYVGNYVSGGGVQNPYSSQGYVIWIPSNGQPVAVLEQVQGFHPGTGFSGSHRLQVLPAPQIPDNATWLTANNNHEVTVPSQSGGLRWRVLGRGRLGSDRAQFLHERHHGRWRRRHQRLQHHRPADRIWT